MAAGIRLLLLLVVATMAAAASAACTRMTSVQASHIIQSTSLLHARSFEPLLYTQEIAQVTPLWAAWKAVLFPEVVTVNCSSSQFVVVSAPRLQELASESASSIQGCGQKKKALCNIEFSPFKHTFFAVRPLGRASLANHSGPLGRSKQPTLKCNVHSEVVAGGGFSGRCAAAVLAVVLLAYAPKPWAATAAAMRLFGSVVIVAGALLALTVGLLINAVTAGFQPVQRLIGLRVHPALDLVPSVALGIALALADTLHGLSSHSSKLGTLVSGKVEAAIKKAALSLLCTQLAASFGGTVGFAAVWCVPILAALLKDKWRYHYLALHSLYFLGRFLVLQAQL